MKGGAGFIGSIVIGYLIEHAEKVEINVGKHIHAANLSFYR